MSDYKVVLGILDTLREKGYVVGGPYKNAKHDGVVFAVKKPRRQRTGNKNDKFLIRVYLDGKQEFADIAVDLKVKPFLLTLCLKSGVYLKFLNKK